MAKVVEQRVRIDISDKNLTKAFTSCMHDTGKNYTEKVIVKQ